MNKFSADKDYLVKKIAELEECELRDQDETKEEVFKKLLICYLIDDQPMKAKFLWKRTPKSFKADSQSELQRIWSLAQFLIQRKYNQAFEFVNQLKKVNYTWSDPEIEVLFERLIEISKEKLFDLLNFAYSTINVQELATILSISNEEAIGVAIGRNWTLDESKLFLLPKKKQKIEIAEIPNQLQMQQLTNLVSFLET